MPKEKETQLKEMGLTEDFLRGVNREGILEDVYDVATSMPDFDPQKYMDTLRDQFNIDYDTASDSLAQDFPEKPTYKGVWDFVKNLNTAKIGRAAGYTLFILGSAAVVGGCVAPSTFDLQPVDRPLVKAQADGPAQVPASLPTDKKDEKPKSRLELEEFTSHSERISRLELFSNRTYLFRGEYTDSDPHKARIGVAVPLGFKKLKGKVIMHHHQDSLGNEEDGAEFHGKIPVKDGKIYLGFFGRERTDSGVEESQRGGYTGFESGGTTLKLGAFGRDDTSIYGVLFQELGEALEMKHLAGVGGRSNADGDGAANIVVGGYPVKKGEGPGYRFLGQTGLQGGSFGKLFIVPWKAGMSKISLTGCMDVDGNGLNDPQPNVMKYTIPGLILTDYVGDGPVGFQLGYRHSDRETELTPLVSLYPLRALGIDPDVQPWTEVQYDTGTREWSGMFGAGYKFSENASFGACYIDKEGGKNDAVFLKLDISW